MPRLKQLLERRASVWEDYQELLARDDDGGWDAETREAIDRAEEELQELTGDIERLRTSRDLEGRFEEVDRSDVPDDDRTGDPAGGGGAGDEAAYEEAFDAYIRRGITGITPEHRSLLESGFVDAEDQLRAQGIETGAGGGFLVPEGFRQKITETMQFFGGMREVSGGIVTASGNDLPWPTNDDTGNEGAYLAEGVAAGEQDVSLGQRKLGAHFITSKLVKASFGLLQDSAFDLESWLSRKLGERIGRRENRAFTTGTGVDQPEGITTNVTVGKEGAAGQETSVTYDDIIDLEHSVDPAYRNERARFMFHDLTLAELRKLKDGDQRPLWQPAVDAGVPDAFNGRPYTVNNDMPEMAADADSILFGDFELGYVIRDVRDIGLIRFNERYADALQVAFLAFARHDAMPDDDAAIRSYQNTPSG